MAVPYEIAMCRCVWMNVGPSAQGQPVMVKVGSGSCSVHGWLAEHK